ncbi:DUF2142 domain-containing protein [Schumannella luteola]
MSRTIAGWLPRLSGFAPVLLGTWVLLALLMSTWALTSPLRSAPDEPSHVIRAVAAVHGDIVGRSGGWFTVDAYYAPGSGPCFAFAPETTPACVVPPLEPDREAQARSSAFVNSPVYYVLVGWPSLFLSGDASVYAMRVVSAILTAGLLALTFALLWRRRAHWATAGLAIAVTPTLLFLGGAVNPNAIEAAGAAALLVSLWSFSRVDGVSAPSWISGLGVVAGALAVSSGRLFGLAWVALAVVAVAVTIRPGDWRALARRRATWVVLAACILVLLVAAIWFHRPIVDGPPKPTNELTPISVVFIMLDSTFSFWDGMIGIFGWIDTPSPDATFVVWTTLIFGALVAGIVLSRGRERAAVLVAAAGLLVLPVVIQTVLYPQIGLVWQGRYMLAGLACALVVIGLALDSRAQHHHDLSVSGRRAARAVMRAVIVLVALGHLGGFFAAVRRYSVGTDSYVDALLSPTWQPPLTSIGSVAIYSVLVLLAAAIAWRSLDTAFGSSRETPLVDFPRP